MAANVNWEMESFTIKFKSLLNAGCKATLNFKADNGHLSVSLSADLPVLPPSKAWQEPYVRPRRKRGPAYYRRQKRRHDTANGTSELVVASIGEQDDEDTPSSSLTLDPNSSQENNETAIQESQSIDTDKVLNDVTAGISSTPQGDGLESAVNVADYFSYVLYRSCDCFFDYQS